MIPKDICFLAGTLGQGGSERQLFYILRALQQRGANLRLLTLTSGEFWEEKIKQLGIPVIWVGKQKARPMRLACIFKILREHPPDVFQSQHFYANLYVVAAARMLGIREVGAIRNNGLKETWSTNQVFGHLSLYTPRVLAANSQASIRNAINMGVPAARLYLLPNAVDSIQFKPAPRAADGPIRLVAVGRLGKEKRFDRFLSILARLQQESSQRVRGMIVGAGSERSYLENRAAELRLLPHQVEFKGASEDVGEVYRQADILVLTSDYEGTPNVVLEAMASGLPVVATRVGGVPEIVQHERTGYVADPEDENSMVEALLNLIGNSRLREEMGRRARTYIEANHSLESLPVSLESLYELALS